MKYKIYDKEVNQYDDIAIVNQEGEIFINLGKGDFEPANQNRYVVLRYSELKDSYNKKLYEYDIIMDKMLRYGIVIYRDGAFCVFFPDNLIEVDFLYEYSDEYCTKFGSYYEYKEEFGWLMNKLIDYEEID